jgi:ribosomal protein S18 acetylase RimI-like enzyme
MKPVKIDNYAQYIQVLEQYNRKGRLTNDYLQNEAADLIIHDRLFAVCGQDNALLLVQKEGFYRVYYYINNTDERLELPKEELVTEILFRGENAPEAEVKWLEDMGFKKNLVRDQYFAKYASLTQPILIEGVKIEIATVVDNALWAIRLFNNSFDKWSGDYIPEAQAQLLIQKKAILVAKDMDGNRLGALQFELKQGACWLNHVAVVPEARGKKVGRGLTEAYIEQGHVDDNSRYMLWVQRQNVSAVAMYRNMGFVPMNKSTLSMIKL